MEPQTATKQDRNNIMYFYTSFTLETFLYANIALLDIKIMVVQQSETAPLGFPYAFSL